MEKLVKFTGVLLLLMIQLNNGIESKDPKSAMGKSDRRPKEERESHVLKTAMELYNVTMDFEEKMKQAFKVDYYDDIIKKEGNALQKEMDALEKQLTDFIEEIDKAGGILPKMENTTTPLDEFPVKVDIEYNTMVKNLKVFTEKIIAAVKRVQRDKQKLKDEVDKFATLKKRFENSRYILEKENIFLRKPTEIMDPEEKFDVSVLERLLKYYTELDEIEDKVEPIVNNYEYDNLDPESEEYRIAQESILKVSQMHELKIRPLVEENDAMLRQYEPLINAAVEGIQKLIPEMANAFDSQRDKIIKLATEFGEQDEKIRGLSKKFNGYLKKANDLALKLAAEGLVTIANPNDYDEHDEL